MHRSIKNMENIKSYRGRKKDAVIKLKQKPTQRFFSLDINKFALSAVAFVGLISLFIIFNPVENDNRDVFTRKQYQFQKVQRTRRDARNDFDILEAKSCCDQDCLRLREIFDNTQHKSVMDDIFKEIEKLRKEICILKNKCFQRAEDEYEAESVQKYNIVKPPVNFKNYAPTGPGEEVETSQQTVLTLPENAQEICFKVEGKKICVANPKSEMKRMETPTAVGAANPYYMPSLSGSQTNNYNSMRVSNIFCSYVELPTLIKFPKVNGVNHGSNRNLMMEKNENLARSSAKISGFFHSCNDKITTIDSLSVCDNKVDCRDGSDEMRCSCKDRISELRHCDGFFDCPNGEDELGCHSCSVDQFSCYDHQESYSHACVSIEKRCDGVADCPNGKDEFDCTLLRDKVGQEDPLVSYGQGFLHRNFRGKWYPVCSDESYSRFAHLACVAEFGPPNWLINVSLVNEKSYKGYFILEDSIHGVTFVKNCSGFATWVECPKPSCGLPSPQKIFDETSYKRYKRGMEEKGFQDLSSQNYVRFCTSHLRNDQDYRMNKNRYPRGTFQQESREKRNEARIVGGTKSPPGAWPWVVAIHKDGSYNCGGVIISSDIVLTAAHCMIGLENSYFEIRAGVLRRSSFSPQEQVRTIKRALIHENFDSLLLLNDIALIEVNKPFSFNRWVFLTCLPPQDFKRPFADSKCITVGWGAVKEHGKEPDDLHQVELNIFETCKQKEDSKANDICAGYQSGGKDSCQGDSGSPLMCRSPNEQWYTAGIVSRGKGCARAGEQGTYTRISKYINWIHKSIKRLLTTNTTMKTTCLGYQCRSGLCLPQNLRCNGVVNCLYADDEINCNNVYPVKSNLMPDSKLPEIIMYNEIDEDSLLRSKNVGVTTIQSENCTSSEMMEPITEKTVIDEHSKKYEDSNPNNTPISKDTKGTHNPTEDTVTSSLSVSVSQTSFFTTEANLKAMVETNATQFENLATENIFHGTSESIATLKPDISSLTKETFRKNPGNAGERNQSTENITFRPNTVEDSVVPVETTTKAISAESNGTVGDVDRNTELTNQSKSTTERDISEKVTEVPEKIESFVEIDKISPKLLSDSLLKGTQDEGIDRKLKNYSTTDSTSIEESPSSKNSPISKTEVSTEKITEDSSTEKIEKGGKTEEIIARADMAKVPKFITTAEPTSEFKPITPSEESSTAKPVSTKESIRTVEPITIIEATTTKPATQEVIVTETTTTTSEVTKTESITTKEPVVDPSYNASTKENGLTRTESPYVFYEKVHERRYKCKNKQWIRESLVCDGIIDCIDLSDESQCSCVQKLKAIMPHLVCDGKIDCLDASDEAYCEDHCEKDEFYCTKSRKCISKEKRCDKINDCGSNEDEEFCYALIPEMPKSHFTEMPKNYTVPIDKGKRPKLTTIGYAYHLENNTWVPYCQELDDLSTVLEICEGLGFREGKLIGKMTSWENGICQTPKLNCSSYFYNDEQPWRAVIQANSRPIAMGVLIKPSWVLMPNTLLLKKGDVINVKLGYIEVTNHFIGVYEQNIGLNEEPGFTPDGETLILNLNQEAILDHKVYPIGSYKMHLEREFRKTNCMAIGLDLAGNERRVRLKLMKDCDPGFNCFALNDTNHSYTINTMTNGFITCESSFGATLVSTFDKFSDDMTTNNCSLVKYRDISAKHDSIDFLLKTRRNKSSFNDSCPTVRCEWGNCLSWEQIGNGMEDCADGRDETGFLKRKKQKHCETSKCACAPGQFSCKKESVCLDLSKYCDGVPDCRDGSDEEGPCESCYDFLAKISPDSICDGYINCHDRSDERNCSKNHVSYTNYFKCHKSDKIIPQELVCDDVHDCPSGEDEQKCYGLEVQKSPYFKNIGRLTRILNGVTIPLCHSNPPLDEDMNKICREKGFIKSVDHSVALTNKIQVVRDLFSEIKLNSVHKVFMRGSRPYVRVLIGEKCPVLSIVCG